MTEYVFDDPAHLDSEVRFEVDPAEDAFFGRFLYTIAIMKQIRDITGSNRHVDDENTVCDYAQAAMDVTEDVAKACYQKGIALIGAVGLECIIPKPRFRRISDEEQL